MQKLAADFPENASYQQHLAWLCARYGPKWEGYGRLPEAEQAARQALATYERLARAYPAVTRFRRNVSDAQEYLGDLLWHSGRRAEAVLAYRRVVTLAEQLNLEDPADQQSLAWFLANCPDPQCRDVRRAVELAGKAVAGKPQVPGYWSTLGLAHYRAGDWPAAIEALEKAVKMQRWTDSSDHFVLAMAYWQLGKKAEAQRWYAEAAQMLHKNEARGHDVRPFREEAEALMKKEPGNQK
jgi:tetratricopeptide (TPR) repeat protein